MNDQFNPLNLTIGATLQIQPTVPEGAPRHQVRLIGYLPKASLVVTAPTHDGKVQIVREAQRFNVRVLMGERVLGFVAQVLLTSLKPYPHLHLEYPAEFQQIVVRNASRVSAGIAAEARNTRHAAVNPEFFPATIVDLSETGAKIASHSLIGRRNKVLLLKFNIEIGGEPEELALLGDVRNLSERQEGGATVFYMGVQFRTPNRFQHILLHAWVTDRMLQESLRAQRG